MARFAIGDIQGCADELRALLGQIRFSADRDRLWFVGDLVNRGPQSLEALRYVRALGDNAIVVLGNHDLHLLAVALGSRDAAKASDTLDAVLAAPDRDQLIEWLLERPLAHFDAEHGDLMVHAGLVRSHGVLGLDTGCVWGGTLTAVDLDARRSPLSVPCRGHRTVGGD